MVNEGIMALPQGQAMLEEEGAQQPTVTSFDSYDAAQTALGQVNPNDLAMLKESLRQNMAELQLTPSQLAALIEIFEYISQNPGEYPKIRAELIRNDFVDAEDLPEEYDPEFLGAMLAVLNELQMTMVQGAQAPMMDAPPVEGMGGAPMAMAQGGLADAAAYMASQGRNGDTMLAHITPQEAQMLQSQGGAGTINPVTGLPEFFLKKVFRGIKKAVKSVANVVKKALQSPIGRILGTIALATVLGPTAIGMTLGSAGTAALASGATTLMAGGSVKEALVAGAMGYVGGGGTIMGASPTAAVGAYLPGAAGSALNTGLSTGVIGTGVGLVAGMDPKQALQMGVTSGLSAAAMQGISNSQQQQLLKDAQFNQEMGMPLTAQQQAAMDAARAAQQAAPTTAEAPSTTSGIRPTGTAQDMLGGGLNINQQAPGFRASTDFGLQDLSTTVGGTAPSTNLNLMPRGFSGEPGFQYTPTFGPQDLAKTAGGTAPSTNYGVAPAQGAPAPTGIMDRMVGGAKDLYNEYLSPSRPGLPADAGMLRKYGPLMAAGTGVIAAAGGMEGKPADENPAFNRNYTGFDYMRDNPDMFRGGLDASYRPPPTPPGVVVPPPSYSSIPIGPPATSVPMGITQSPAGVAQPYNAAGLYGVPLLYGQQPVRRAKGGEMYPTNFPRKTGPIDGPGTGTSDSIPAMLSDGEFVFTAKAVRNAGSGSRRKGAARMYRLMKKLEGGPVKAEKNG